MIPSHDAPAHTVLSSVAHSLSTLRVAATIEDPDLSDDDRKFFTAKADELQTHFDALFSTSSALERFDLTEAVVLQATVVLGDDILDRGVSDAVRKTKDGLKSKPGLGAEHAFGARVSDLVNAPLRAEPRLVVDAATRMNDLPDFAGKADLAKDLVTRAELQEKRLDARDAGARKRSALEGAVATAKLAAVTALAALGGSLTERFPRRRAYVATFALHDHRAHRAKKATPDPVPAPPKG